MINWEHFDAPLTESTDEELKALFEEAHKETKQLIAKVGLVKAKEITDKFLFKIAVDTLLSDMYVYQRVDAIRQGIVEAQEKHGNQRAI